VLTKVVLQAPPAIRIAAFAVARFARRIPQVRRAQLRRMTMIDLGYDGGSPILPGTGGAVGRRVPNVRLRSPSGERPRLYDLMGYRAAVLDLSGCGDDTFRRFLDDVIRIGVGGLADDSGLLSGLLDGRPGWILVRPDGHVAQCGHDPPLDPAAVLTRSLGLPRR
jgi:hypothetical protein